MNVYELEKTDADFIDEIPKHWNLNRAKKIYREVDERSADGSEILLSVSEFTGVTPKQKKYEDADWVGRAESLEGYKKCKKGDLVSNIMLAWKRGLGVTEHNGIVSPAYCVYRSNHKAHPKYMHYLLRDVLYTTEFKRHSRGIIDSRLRLYSQYFLPIPLITPPIEEQEIIAKHLKELSVKINKVIKLKEKQIEKIEYYYFIKLSEIMSGKNSQKNKYKKHIYLGDIPFGWKIKRLKDVLSTKLKYGANEAAELEDTSLPRYIRITDFDNYGTLRDDTFKSLPFEIAENYFLEEGDVLFARSGATVGKTFQFKNYQGKACFAGYLIRAKPNVNLILSDFLFFFTKSKLYQNWKDMTFTQSTIENIGADKYQHLEIPLPTIEEQRIIIEKVHHITNSTKKLVGKINSQIETIRQYKESIIHECVTGKKCVLEVKNG